MSIFVYRWVDLNKVSNNIYGQEKCENKSAVHQGRSPQHQHKLCAADFIILFSLYDINCNTHKHTYPDGV